jgi:hypothetical protein
MLCSCLGKSLSIALPQASSPEIRLLMIVSLPGKGQRAACIYPYQKPLKSTLQAKLCGQAVCEGGTSGEICRFDAGCQTLQN